MDKSIKKLIDWQKAALMAPQFGFIEKLHQAYPEAQVYLVGGAVRDILLGRQTKDYDFVVANLPAKQLENFLQQLGEVDLVGKSFGVFKFVPKDFHVGSPTPSSTVADTSRLAGEEKFEAIDIALPRTEKAGMSGGYQDFEVQSDPYLPIASDLSRRDFTINALAWNLNAHELVDEFGGLADLQNKIIKAIGDPAQRFQEDYTRMLRAVRFLCQLGFEIEAGTLLVINQKAKEIKKIATERINEELTKIIMSDRAEEGIRLLQAVGILDELIPELTDSMGVSQNKQHIYDVYEHSVRALGAAAKNNFGLEVRLAALLHDIGKPATKEGQGIDSTFYNHDQVGAKIAKKILRRLGYSNEVVDYATHLVRYHMFYYALDTVSDSGVRRLLSRIGKENIDDFIAVRICDRLGMGRPKAKPWKLIELERRFKEVQLDPITPKMIALKGDELMQLLQIQPGPRVGLLLNAMLGEVLDDPSKNDHDYLIGRVKELQLMPDAELKKLNPDVKFFEEERKRELHRPKNDED